MYVFVIGFTFNFCLERLKLIYSFDGERTHYFCKAIFFANRFFVLKMYSSFHVGTNDKHMANYIFVYTLYVPLFSSLKQTK